MKKSKNQSKLSYLILFRVKNNIDSFTDSESISLDNGKVPDIGCSLSFTLFFITSTWNKNSFSNSTKSAPVKTFNIKRKKIIQIYIYVFSTCAFSIDLIQ